MSENTGKSNNGAIPTEVDTVSDDDFVLDGTVLKKYKGKAKEAAIPYGVTKIGEWSFDRCTELTGIVIPDSVTSIGDYAFYNSGLKSIDIPDSVTSIGDNAFRFCGNLASVTISDSVTSIGEGAFGCCGSLINITVAGGNKRYRSAGNCVIETATETLIAGCGNSAIPTDGSVTSIGEEAFYGCKNLRSIEIPDSVTSIGMYAFYGCDNLTSVAIPVSLKSIEGQALGFCDSLSSITVADGNKRYRSAGNCIIEKYTETLVLGCGNSVIPTDGSVTSIGMWAFCGCRNLTSITVPDSVESIEDYAFCECDELKNAEIPETCEYRKYSFPKDCKVTRRS